MGAHVRSQGPGDPTSIKAGPEAGLFGEWYCLYFNPQAPFSSRTVVCGIQDLGFWESKCRWHEIDLPQLSPCCLVFSQGIELEFIFFGGGASAPTSVLSACFQLLLPILGSCLYLHSPLGGLTHLPRSPGLTPPAHPQLLLSVAGEVADFSAPNSALLCCPASEILFGFPPLCQLRAMGGNPTLPCAQAQTPESTLPLFSRSMWKPPGSPLDPLSK